MLITLIRHGQTETNLKRGYIGITDEPLCEEGLINAKKATNYPEVDKVYTSGMKRTNQTAKIMFPNANVLEIPELREMNFGIFEGYNHKELEGQKAYSDWLDSKCEGRCPSGEKRSEFFDRCVSSFLEIIHKEKEKNTDELYFVVHGGVIMAIVSELVVPKSEYYKIRIDCCQSYLMEYGENQIFTAKTI